MSPSSFVCVVIDECHKSLGNYATVKAVQFLKSHGAQFRVLGLSATPGRTKDTIQVMTQFCFLSLTDLAVSDSEFDDWDSGV